MRLTSSHINEGDLGLLCGMLLRGFSGHIAVVSAAVHNARMGRGSPGAGHLTDAVRLMASGVKRGKVESGPSFLLGGGLGRGRFVLAEHDLEILLVQLGIQSGRGRYPR